MMDQHVRLGATRTKIVATVGPACRDRATISELIRHGVTVFRINTAHGSRAEHEAAIATIRSISDASGQPVAILVDLAGPKIRLGTLREDPTECRVGAEFSFVRGDAASAPDEFVANYKALIDELEVGNRVMLADGTVALEVVAKDADRARCAVTGAGIVRSRQGINLPGVRLSVPAMTDADRENARWAAGAGVDFVSLSFVRRPDEIRTLRQLLSEYGSTALVIAKIEKREALDRLDDIVEAADGVMVARGDLGVEIDLAETPSAQKLIINKCQQHAKPVIVATQMLDSMQNARRPTRAEVSDVANAILDGADACMLSGETAIGQFPVEAVEMMRRVMEATERDLSHEQSPRVPVAALAKVHPITAATVHGASEVARRLHATLVVIATHAGSTARFRSKYRDRIRTVGVSDSPVTLRRMCLFWGVTPLPAAPVSSGPELREFIDQWGRQAECLACGDRVVYLTVSDFVTNAHNGIIVQEVL